MPQCPQCHQPVDSQAVICPHCRTPLKAYGHPGITLHRSSSGTYLCDSCTYHVDDSCNYPQRPFAQECTLYDDLEARQREVELWEQLQHRQQLDWRNWYRRYPGLVGVILLLLVSILITLLVIRR